MPEGVQKADTVNASVASGNSDVSDSCSRLGGGRTRRYDPLGKSDGRAKTNVELPFGCRRVRKRRGQLGGVTALDQVPSRPTWSCAGQKSPGKVSASPVKFFTVTRTAAAAT